MISGISRFSAYGPAASVHGRAAPHALLRVCVRESLVGSSMNEGVCEHHTANRDSCRFPRNMRLVPPMHWY